MILTHEQFCLQGTEVEHNRKSYACVLSGLRDFGAKPLQARECLLLIKILQEGHEEEIE